MRRDNFGYLCHNDIDHLYNLLRHSRSKFGVSSTSSYERPDGRCDMRSYLIFSHVKLKMFHKYDYIIIMLVEHFEFHMYDYIT